MRALARSQDVSRLNPTGWRRMLQLVWTHPEAGGLDRVNQYLENTLDVDSREGTPSRPESLIWS